MERLQELEILIAAQEKKVEDIYQGVEKVTKQANEECKKFLLDIMEQTLEGRKVNLRGCIDDLGGNISVELQDENGKNVFGSGFEIYLHSRSWDRDNNTKVEFNIGTCGSFDKNDKDQIMKYELFARCLVNFEQIENYLLERYFRIVEANKPYREADRELDRLINEKASIEDKIKEQAILDSIKVDNLYQNVKYRRWQKGNGWKENEFCKVVAIKANTIELEVGYMNSDKFFYCDDCRVKKEEFISGLKWERYRLVENI